MDWRCCNVCGSYKNPGLRMFSVPKDKVELQMWCNACKINLPRNGFVCQKHFSDNDIQTKRLKKGALPLEILAQQDSTPISPSSFPSTSQVYPIMNEDIPSSSNSEYIAFSDTMNVGNLNDIFNELKSDKTQMILPFGWGIHKLDKHILFTKMCIDDNSSIITERSIILSSSCIIAKAREKILNLEDTVVNSLKSVQELIENMDTWNMCHGNSKSCAVLIPTTCNSCKACTSYKYFTKKRQEKQTKVVKKKHKFNYTTYLSRRNAHLSRVVTNLRQEKANMVKLDELLGTLPDVQQEMIKTCLKSAKCKLSGRRYSLEWVYNCILMKIKSPKLYNHIRDKQIMAMPSPSTLSRYIRNIDGTFGFKREVFVMIKEKTKHMGEWQRHGCLLVDECKINPTKKFDKNTMEFVGFVDLGKYTPKSMEDQLGDHVLVIMFQPFAGHGLQALGCFLTKGNITGELQAKLILECVILCENAGLLIDTITSDGAAWNRSMWKNLGVENSSQPWCEHPMDPSRKLRMCSDFPHLIKCLRNILEKKRTLQVPEGLVRYDIFENLIKHESTKQFKMAFKLTKAHVHPNFGEKMSTRLALQLFSNTVASAIEVYNIELGTCTEPTVAFCRRINKLVDIMNSSNPKTALKIDSEGYRELQDFLLYLELWEECSPQDIFLSKSTFEGLKATISCTLDLTDYLTQTGFKYFMTARINQDHLEHFFGMMRVAGGCNSHPESIQVGQIFRLMSLFSLVKPPRGSNVTGGDMIHSLITVGDLKEKKTIKFVFDLNIDSDDLVNTVVNEYEEEFENVEEAFAYFCGYIAKKAKNSTKCSECLKTICGDGNEKFNSFIQMKSRGFLTFPSNSIILFLTDIEKTISDVFQSDLKKCSLSLIGQKLADFKPKILLGCIFHTSEFTKNIIEMYVISRLSICCSEEQKLRKMDNKSKKLAKLAKLN